MIPKEMYKHTQVGWWILITYVGTIFVLILVGLVAGISQFFIPFFVALIASFVILWSFLSLTVLVDNDFINIKFSLGLIRKSFKLIDIKSCTVVRNQWWYGWGIHWIPNKFWVFNISGLDAVELVMNNGKIYRIGTDEPQKLDAVIKSKSIKGR